MKIIDTHIHCIPYIDDGAQSFDEAVAMINMGYEEGIGLFICTPHSEFITKENKLEKVIEGRKMLQSEVDVPIVGLVHGCEIYCTLHNIDRVIEDIGSGLYYALAEKSDHYLIEFDYNESADRMIEMCCRLTEQDYPIRPVLAHAERYRHIDDIVDDVRKLGCMIQINVSSVTDEAFFSRSDKTIRLLEKRNVDFLGTDAHRLGWRPPKVKDGIKVIQELLPEEYVRDLAYRNALRYLFSDYGISEDRFR